MREEIYGLIFRAIGIILFLRWDLSGGVFFIQFSQYVNKNQEFGLDIKRATRT